MLPIIVGGRENDFRRAPCRAVPAFRIGDRFLRPPGKPHPVEFAVPEHRHVEKDSEVAAEDGIVFVLFPSGGRFTGRQNRAGEKNEKTRTPRKRVWWFS